MKAQMIFSGIAGALLLTTISGGASAQARYYPDAAMCALLDGAELAVEPGARLCLVGRNGSGKSTLLKIAAGLVEPDGPGWRLAAPAHG